MAKNLVIVESPAKSKTITKILWSDFEVKASLWHIVELPKKYWGTIELNYCGTVHSNQGSQYNNIIPSLIKISNLNLIYVLLYD